jgi:hypothetical protein
MKNTNKTRPTRPPHTLRRQAPVEALTADTLKQVGGGDMSWQVASPTDITWT